VYSLQTRLFLMLDEHSGKRSPTPSTLFLLFQQVVFSFELLNSLTHLVSLNLLPISAVLGIDLIPHFVIGILIEILLVELFTLVFEVLLENVELGHRGVSESHELVLWIVLSPVLLPKVALV
jgi:hypothetical protein